MDLQILVFVLLAAGIALIFAELFVPSGGMIAMICVVCFGASIFFAYRSWYDSHPLVWWIYLGSLLIIIPGAVFGAFQILLKTPLGNRVLLAAPTSDEVTPYQREQDQLAGMVGKQGIALNPMMPGGLVRVDGERLHAVSNGMPIPPNAKIEVVAVRGQRVVVALVDPETENEVTEAFDPNSMTDDSEGGEETIDPFNNEDEGQPA